MTMNSKANNGMGRAISRNRSLYVPLSRLGLMVFMDAKMPETRCRGNRASGSGVEQR